MRYGGRRSRLARRGRSRLEELGRNLIRVFDDPSASDLDPEVLAASRGDDREQLVGKLRKSGELVLGGAELSQGRLRLLRKQLSEDAVDGIGGQPSRGEVDLSGWRHDVRLVAHMHDKRFAIDSDNRLQQ